MGSSVQLTVQSTLTRMPNIKLTYFDLRARAEPCRLLLAYGGLKYEDERIPPPWDPASTWATVKPTTPFGQLPLLQWGDEVICQSMACARFIAREVGLAGNTSMESAQVDEIIDVIQDLINAFVKLYFAKDEAGQKNHAEVTVPTALHTFMYISDLPDKDALKNFPMIANLVERVGNIPNIKNWVETRPVTSM